MKLEIYYKMVKGMVKVLPFYLFTFLPLNTMAQTFTQRLQKSATGEGTIIIHHDAVIDELVNGTKAVLEQPKTQKQTTHKTENNKPLHVKQQKAVAQQHTEREKEKVQEPQTHHELVVDGQQNNEQEETANVKRYKTTGYRVQVFRGGNSKADRQRAEAAGTKMRDAFPGEEVYVEFFTPDWTCRLGNYRDIEDARRVREEVRKMGYDGATIVKGKIIVTVPQ